MERRESGRYYTPSSIVQRMLAGCLAPRVEQGKARSNERLRILDPACGEGAFLRAAFEWLCGFQYGAPTQHVGQRTSVEERLRIVREHLFGVDIDSDAVGRLRRWLQERVDPDGMLPGEVRRVIEANICIGDALTGPDFGNHTTTRPLAAVQSATTGRGLITGGRPAPGSAGPRRTGGHVPSVNWRRAFPEAAQAGGFDVIVTNPPYRRELNAKARFDRIAASPLGQRWREARMDLWYYFLHRGLDVLRPGGRLSFIVNSYWTASRGARKLIDRLQRETTIEEIALLDAVPVFQGVAGRHMIFRLRRGHRPAPCRVVNSFTAPTHEVYEIPQRRLYQEGRLVLRPPEPPVHVRSSGRTLGDWFEVRQGMAENPPWITARLSRKYGGRYRAGEGVFVLTGDEVEALQLTRREHELLRSYYRTSAVRRYGIADDPTHRVLYLTKNTVPTLDDCPTLQEHLGRFRPILERRRETRKGAIAWWQLHWPREERLFTEPRILSVQMGWEPQFVWAEQPTFVGFSINLVLADSDEAFSLPALTGILNSTFAHDWFESHAKRRGVNLEINGGLLRRFPLPTRNPDVEESIARLVKRRQSIQADEKASAKGGPLMRLDASIDELVGRLYEQPGDGDVSRLAVRARRRARGGSISSIR